MLHPIEMAFSCFCLFDHFENFLQQLSVIHLQVPLLTILPQFFFFGGFVLVDACLLVQCLATFCWTELGGAAPLLLANQKFADPTSSPCICICICLFQIQIQLANQKFNRIWSGTNMTLDSCTTHPQKTFYNPGEPWICINFTSQRLKHNFSDPLKVM